MIWIIGGTKDSRDILEKLLEKTESDIIVSTATDYGGKLLENYKEREKRVESISERLDESQMRKLIKQKNISLVIDASHPYAVNVSRSVLKVTDEMDIGYMRFERKMLDYGDRDVIRFSTLEDMKRYVMNFENKNIFSTLGSNNLGEIKEIGKKNNLFVRILPTSSSIQKAEELGYLPGKIIAVQGPVSKILNEAMLKSYNIDFLITKESGDTGGEREKIEACKECKVTVLVLKRPQINYGNVYNDIDALIEKICQ